MYRKRYAKKFKISIRKLLRSGNDIREVVEDVIEILAAGKALERKYHEVRSEAPTWPAWKFTNTEGPRIETPEYVKKKAAKKS